MTALDRAAVAAADELRDANVCFALIVWAPDRQTDRQAIAVASGGLSAAPCPGPVVIAALETATACLKDLGA